MKLIVNYNFQENLAIKKNHEQFFVAKTFQELIKNVATLYMVNGNKVYLTENVVRRERDFVLEPNLAIF